MVRTADPRRVRNALLVAVAVLGALSLAAQAAREWVPGSPTANALGFFNATHEHTVPTLFSTLLLLGCAAIAAAIASGTAAQRTRWWLLAAVLFAFAIDESVAVHEATIPPLRRLLHADGILYFTWVVPGALLTLAIVLGFRTLATELPRAQRRLFAIAALLYFGGALGFELAEGWLAVRYGLGSVPFIPVSAAEEVLEMAGAVLFSYVLMQRLGPWQMTLRLARADQRDAGERPGGAGALGRLEALPEDDPGQQDRRDGIERAEHGDDADEAHRRSRGEERVRRNV